MCGLGSRLCGVQGKEALKCVQDMNGLGRNAAYLVVVTGGFAVRDDGEVVTARGGSEGNSIFLRRTPVCQPPSPGHAAR